MLPDNYRVGIYLRAQTGDGSAQRVKDYWDILNSAGGEDCLYVNTREREHWPRMADWLHERLAEYSRVLTQEGVADN